jgi:hypothetical protein
MRYSLESVPIPEMPRLAWVASIPKTPGTVQVVHGTGVEQCDDAVVEGCWDGAFSEGGFERHLNFFGSGITVDRHEVVAASSRSLTDRIVWADGPTGYLCANSLPLLLSFAKARMCPDVYYGAILSSVLQGIRHYTSDIPVRGRIDTCHQVFGHNVVFRGSSVERSYRKGEPLVLNDFEAYQDALHRTLDRLVRNCRDPARKTPVSIASTLSTGYDSPAVTAMLHRHGLEKVFTTRPTDLAPDLENGALLADALGVEAFLLERSEPSFDTELFLLAGAIDGRETVFSNATEEIRRGDGTVAMFTGYHGDSLWDIAPPPRRHSPDIIRGDTSGLNLCEARLRSGFYNIAVPFIFADRIDDLVRISQSPEMQPWSVGGSYDRPIPRRIAEEAGLERESFGQEKRVVLSYEVLPLNPRLRRDFVDSYKAALGRSRFYANILTGDLDDAVKLILRKLRLPFSLPRTRRALTVSHFANQIFIFAVDEIVARHQRLLPVDP